MYSVAIYRTFNRPSATQTGITCFYAANIRPSLTQNKYQLVYIFCVIQLSEIIKTLRKRKGLTQKQLAELLGIKSQSLQQWESGRTTPSSKKFASLANALGVSVNDLINGTLPEEEKKSEVQKEEIPAGHIVIATQELLDMQRKINDLQSELLKYQKLEIERQRSLRPN